MVTMVVFKSLVLLFLLPVCFRANEIPTKPKPSEPNEIQSKDKSSQPIENEVPWLVSVQVDDWHSCVGSIIGPTWILTTAYCIL